MDYNAIHKTLAAQINWVGNFSKGRLITEEEKILHTAYIQNLKDAQDIIKRVKHYGGVDELIKQANNSQKNLLILEVEALNG